MTKVEFDRLTAGKTPRADKETLFRYARWNHSREEAAYKSALGADVAEAPVWSMVADTLAVIAEGADIAETVAYFDAQWKAYATENNKRITEAPKIRHGGRRGQSVISHRYTAPELYLDRVQGYLPK